MGIIAQIGVLGRMIEGALQAFSSLLPAFPRSAEEDRLTQKVLKTYFNTPKGNVAASTFLFIGSMPVAPFRNEMISSDLLVKRFFTENLAVQTLLGAISRNQDVVLVPFLDSKISMSGEEYFKNPRFQHLVVQGWDNPQGIVKALGENKRVINTLADPDPIAAYVKQIQENLYPLLSEWTKEDAFRSMQEITLKRNDLLRQFIDLIQQIFGEDHPISFLEQLENSSEYEILEQFAKLVESFSKKTEQSVGELMHSSPEQAFLVANKMRECLEVGKQIQKFNTIVTTIEKIRAESLLSSLQDFVSKYGTAEKIAAYVLPKEEEIVRSHL